MFPDCYVILVFFLEPRAPMASLSFRVQPWSQLAPDVLLLESTAGKAGCLQLIFSILQQVSSGSRLLLSFASKAVIDLK